MSLCPDMGTGSVSVNGALFSVDLRQLKPDYDRTNLLCSVQSYIANNQVIFLLKIFTRETVALNFFGYISEVKNSCHL